MLLLHGKHPVAISSDAGTLEPVRPGLGAAQLRVHVGTLPAAPRVERVQLSHQESKLGVWRPVRTKQVLQAAGEGLLDEAVGLVYRLQICVAPWREVHERPRAWSQAEGMEASRKAAAAPSFKMTAGSQSIWWRAVFAGGS